MTHPKLNLMGVLIHQIHNLILSTFQACQISHYPDIQIYPTGPKPTTNNSILSLHQHCHKLRYWIAIKLPGSSKTTCSLWKCLQSKIQYLTVYCHRHRGIQNPFNHCEVLIIWGSTEYWWETIRQTFRGLLCHALCMLRSRLYMQSCSLHPPACQTPVLTSSQTQQIILAVTGNLCTVPWAHSPSYIKYSNTVPTCFQTYCYPRGQCARPSATIHFACMGGHLRRN